MAARLFLLLPFFLSFPQLSAQQNLANSFSINNSPWLPEQTDRNLVSPNSIFAAGFHPVPATPQLFVFSIWYRRANRTVVWSLNGDDPVNASASLNITAGGALQLNGSTGKNLWHAAAGGGSNASRLVLQENGSLVFGNWTSFDFPTDTILPNQPFLNGTTLTSRRDKNSYARGNYRFEDAKTLVFNQSDGYWDAEERSPFKALNGGGVITQENQKTMIAADVNSVVSRRLTLDIDGNLRLYSLDPASGAWKIVWQAIQELCKIHGSCGPNFVCTNNGSDAKTCSCPAGFQITANGGCDRKIKLSTADPSSSRFLRMDFVKFDTGRDLQDLNLTTCQARCLADRRCRGFAARFDGEQYCGHYIDGLMNGYWSPGSGTASFVRVDRSEREESNFTGMTTLLETVCPVNISLPFPPKESNAERRNLAIICSLFAVELISGVLSFWAFLRRYSKYRDMARTFGLEFLPAGGPKRFSYAELKAATNDFSHVLGQGGFGVVYRGELPDHRVVAVKRLKNVASGEAEFWAEVTIIARMHHLNLVRMWGFCAEKGQRMLVYEYIQNGSLDKFLFPVSTDPNGPAPPKRPILDWSIRYRIALGVARAIAYLHEECLEWVLHCDIKPENILLEDDFCPKVSDFGLAKLAKKEDKVSMSRIRGTRGYLAPEWVRPGEPITAKADVYSFGMVLLEIVSGIRNFDFRRSSLESEEWYFPRWAFEKVYAERQVEELLDRRIIEIYDGRAHLAMVDRMVKTAMWCLQDRPEMRPSMGKVAKMLEGTVEITEPEKPTIFYLGEE
ncbi:hypothetical protein ACLOJK_006986 [Asimina triloba]